MIATVPESAWLTADLPEWCVGARVFVDDGWHLRHRDGLPRDVQDLLGRVTAARWESDSEVDLEIVWGNPDANWGELVENGSIALSLVILPERQKVEVLANPVVPHG